MPRTPHRSTRTGTGKARRPPSPPAAEDPAPLPPGEPPGAREPFATTAAHVPVAAGLDELAKAAADCRAYDLWERGTQTVFGEGAQTAEVVLVGEQPGDREDVEGRPFVGPAGRVLDDALAAAGLDRTRTYVTNVVKHFKWEPRGKRRIHQKPNAGEIRACRPWLDAELAALRPRAVVRLGATAAQALLGKDFKVTLRRGELIDGTGIAPLVMATVHPSSILRAPDEAARRAALQALVKDLEGLARVLASG